MEARCLTAEVFKYIYASFASQLRVTYPMKGGEPANGLRLAM